MSTVRDLLVYKKAFSLSMDIFEAAKGFPKEETYSLTDQIRRSSRSVCANLSEAYRKRQYPKHFVAKVSDADSENAETQTWLEYAQACGYLNATLVKELIGKSEEVGRLLNDMIRNPKKYN